LLRLWRATINTRNGLAFAIRSEQAVREELFALVLSVPLAWIVGATLMRRIELVAAVAMVLVVGRTAQYRDRKALRSPDDRA